MKINYYFCFKEDKRSSMDMLGNYISKSQKKFRNNNVLKFIPKIYLPKWLSNKNFFLRFERYLSYPFQVFFEKQTDIAHVIDHSYSHLVKYINAKKKVVTINDLIPLVFGKKLNRNFLLFKYSVSKIIFFDHVIALSKQSKNDLIKFTKIDPKKISVVYPDVEKIFNLKKVNKKKLNKIFKLPYETKKIISFDTSFYKNFKYTYSVFKEILKTNPNVIILKIGNFSDDEIEEKHKKQIFTYNSLSRKEMSNLYKISDILFFPSLYEGFGIPCLEAMKCGLPVISSSNGSLKEFVNNRSLFNLNNKTKILNEILKILSNKKYSNKARKVSINQSKILNKVPYHKQINKIYKDLLAQSSSN